MTPNVFAKSRGLIASKWKVIEAAVRQCEEPGSLVSG